MLSLWSRTHRWAHRIQCTMQTQSIQTPFVPTNVLCAHEYSHHRHHHHHPSVWHQRNRIYYREIEKELKCKRHKKNKTKTTTPTCTYSVIYVYIHSANNHIHNQILMKIKRIAFECIWAKSWWTSALIRSTGTVNAYEKKKKIKSMQINEYDPILVSLPPYSSYIHTTLAHTFIWMGRSNEMNLHPKYTNFKIVYQFQVEPSHQFSLWCAHFKNSCYFDCTLNGPNGKKKKHAREIVWNEKRRWKEKQQNIFFFPLWHSFPCSHEKPSRREGEIRNWREKKIVIDIFLGV